MTAASSATAWISARDPGLLAFHRALRNTLAACVGFFLCRYAIGDPVLATYAVFGAIAIGVLSDVTGSPKQRTRTYLGALPVGLVLVAIGTAAARSTVAAVIGMLVVGFAVAYAGVGGPRIAGIANGLQLFYILPCFPPYDPGSLPERMAGLAIGILLVTIADRLLWPAPAPESFAGRIADTADVVARYVAAVSTDERTSDGPGDEAENAVRELRPSSLPAGARPMGPGHRDRGLTHAATALRTMVFRTRLLARLLPDVRNPAATRDADDLLAIVGDAVRCCSAALRGAGPAPKGGPVVAGVEHYLDDRADRIARRVGRADLPPVVRVGGLAADVGEAARGLVAATRAATGAPRDPTAATPAAAWYVDVPTPMLWWRRLRAHLTPRSVYFQNALRLALGLAAARLAADLLDLSHGFWVLLATLSLMRTSLVSSGLALIPAFLGTLAGAFAAAGVLALVGGNTTVYAIVLPLAMVVAFVAGPLIGPFAGQFGFTVVVAVLFAQIAPTTWKLAEVRLLDVVVGGLVGTLIGAAVWPRGGGGEVRRSAAECLRRAADEVTATVRALTGDPLLAAAPPRSSPAKDMAVLFDATYAQYRSEPGRRPATRNWIEVLGSVQRAASDAQTLRTRYPEPPPLPWPAVSERLVAASEEFADAFRDAADAVRAGTTEPSERHLVEGLDAHPPHGAFADDPHAALRVIDAWGWLHGLADDLDRAERAAAGRSR